MGNLFKLILIQILLQGINAELRNMAPENWNDVIFDSQNGDEYCFYMVRPLINQLKRVNKQIDANDEMKETIGKLEKELDRVKMQLKEQEIKYKEELLKAKNEGIKDLKDLIISKNERIEEQLKSQSALLAENKNQIKDLNNLINSKNKHIGDQLKATNDLLKSKDEQIRKQFEAQNSLLAENKNQIKDLNNLINSKNKHIGDQLKTTNDLLKSKDEQIRKQFEAQNSLLAENKNQIKDLNNLINSKNKHIGDQLKTTNDLLKSKDEQIRKQFEAQNSLLAENKKRIQDLSDLINSKDKQIGDQLISNNDLLKSKDEQINQLKNTINANNKQIDELRTQISKDEKNQQMMKYNQQEENLPNSGLYFDNVHRIQIAGHPAFEVSYISPLSGWTVIQRRMDGSEDFERDWMDYKNGFGDIRGEFFLGLEKIHLMTQSRPHELYIQMRDVNGTNKYARYDNFKVGNEKDNYKLISTGEYNGTAGDSFSQHVGYMFTTRDRDNDKFDYNCASSGGGWWYLDCGYSQLNGKFNVDGTDQRKNGIAWGTWKDGDYKISLTFTQMMIRPTLQFN